MLARITIERENYRAAYDRYRASFVRIERARVASITFTDSVAAAALAQQAVRAPSLRDAASTAGLAGRVSDESLTFPAASPTWTQFENHITMMRPGEIAGPLEIEGGWLVFQLVDKQQDAPPFESLSPAQRGQLQGVATEIKREARLNAVTDSLRQALAPVVVYPNRLRNIPWPPAPLSPAGS